MKKRRLMFICPDCDKGLRQVPFLIKKISEFQTQLDEMKILVDKLTTAHTDTNVNQNGQCIMQNEQLIQELNERQIRSANVIMLNIAESGKLNRRARMEDDIMKAKEIIEQTEVVVDNVKVYRLGRYNAGTSRALKVVLADQNCAHNIIKNRNKVQNVRSIFADKTKMQQEYYKRIKNELEVLKQNGDSNKTIKYINNVPTIVEKRQDIEKN